ncbi:MAG: hypothetical protein AAFP19_23030 [Bacteroidota bacterium]
MIRFLLLPILLLAAFSSLSAQIFPPDQSRYTIEREQIKAKLLDLSRYIVEADIGQIITCYTWDGLRYPERGTLWMRKGLEEDLWHIPNGEDITAHDIQLDQLVITDQDAFCNGKYYGKSLDEEGREVPWEGYFNIQWLRVDNDWQIETNSWLRIVEY